MEPLPSFPGKQRSDPPRPGDFSGEMGAAVGPADARRDPSRVQLRARQAFPHRAAICLSSLTPRCGPQETMPTGARRRCPPQSCPLTSPARLDGVTAAWPGHPASPHGGQRTRRGGPSLGSSSFLHQHSHLHPTPHPA